MPTAQYGDNEYGGFEYGGHFLTLAASTATSTSTALSATVGRGWTIDSTPISPTAVTATPDTLELTIPTRTSAVRSLLDTLDANAGEVRQRERADGTLDAMDTAAGANTYTLYANIYSKPPRQGRTVHVEDIARERSGPDGQTITADITLKPTESRAIDADTEADDTTQWRFDFAPGGRIVTNRLAANINQDRETTTLQLVLTPLQTQTLETSTAAVAGAVSQNVPDGESLDRDTTPNSRQTVTITPPSGASNPPISQGDYLALGWTTTGQGEGGYRVELELTSL